MADQFDPNHMDRLLDEGRREWNDPQKILQYLNLGPEMVMADVGCGPGWFTLEAARQMAPTGLVYGIDLSEAMLEQLRRRAREQGLTNVQAVLAEKPDEWPVPTGSVDVALLANVYHEVDPSSMLLGEIRRILKPASTCMVVDWRKEETPVGPPVAARVDQQDVTAEFYAAGFVLAGTCDVGPYHYGLKFYRARGPEEPAGPMGNPVP